MGMHIHRAWGKVLVITSVSLSMALLAFGAAGSTSARALAAGLDTPTPTAGYPQQYELYKPPVSTQGVVTGIASPSLFGPLSCLDYGDANLPISPDYNAIGGKYTYRIAIPSDYAGSQVDVELFDPDTSNKSTSTATITKLDGTTATGTCSSPANVQTAACVLSTADTGNPWWIMKADENRLGNGAGSCSVGSYSASSNTRTLYRLYYYDANGNQVDLAYYVGKNDYSAQPLLSSSGYTAAEARTEALATDLMWVSPGAPDGSRLPAYSKDQVVNGLPMLIASAAEPATLVEDCNTARALTITNSAGTFPVSGASTCQGDGDFLVDLDSEIPGLAAEANGTRNIYLDIRSLSGAAENVYDIWAGPPPTGLPAEANARNLAIGSQLAAGHANPADPGGVQIYGDHYQSLNTDAVTGTTVDAPLVYLSPDMGGKTVSLRAFDIDSGSLPPIVFYLDNFPKTTWAACFADNAAQCVTAGSSTGFYIGPSNVPGSLAWNTYNFSVPATISGYDFAGGNLMVTYPSGYMDTVVWNAGGGPPNPPILSSPAGGASVTGTPAYSWQASGSSWADRYVLQYDDNADFSSPLYTSGNISGLTFAAPFQTPGTYYWRVRAGDNHDEWSFWSIPRAVTVLPSPPDAPALLSPADNGLTDDTTPLFSWASAPRADTYTIQIDDTADFSSPIESYSTASSSELSYTPAPLGVGLYYWRVRGTNTIGDGPWSARSVRIYASLPLMPTNMRVTALTMSTITVAWSDTDIETGFRVERSDDGLSGWTPVGSTARDTLSFQDTGLACATQYYYHVQAFNVLGDSAFTNPIAASTGVCPPAAPGDLTATAVSQNQIDLAWTDNASNESGFRIERSPAGAATWRLLGTVAADTTTYSDTGLTCGAGYDYRVAAINMNGISAMSGTASQASAACNDGAPSNLSATGVSQSEIDLAWTDNASDEDGFKLERSPAGLNNWTLIATLGADQAAYQDMGSTCGTSFDYRISAFNAAGSTATTAPASATTVLCAPASPTNLSATAISGTQVNLAWTDKSSNETGFKIERSPAGRNAWVVLMTTGPNQTSYSDTTPVCNTSYQYRVSAVNAFGSSVGVTINGISTQACPIPPPYYLYAMPFALTQINLTWTENATNESGFKLERSLAGQNNWTLFATTGPNSSSFSSTGLTCGTAYDFRAYTYTSTASSVYSNIATATTATCIPPAASGLVATPVSESQIDLTWVDNSPYETVVKVERAPSGSSTWTTLANLGPNSTTYSATGLSCLTGYTFRVTAMNANGAGLPSTTATATTLNCLPAAPSNLSLTPGQQFTNLGWTDNAFNETGFVIERSPAGANTWTLIATLVSNETRYFDGGLTCATSYDYRIYAYNSVGNSPYLSATLMTWPCTLPIVTNLTAVPDGPDRITVAWTDNATNEAEYRIRRSIAGASAWTLIATLPADSTTYTDPTVTCGTSYDYRVSPSLEHVESTVLPGVLVTTPPCTPNGPTSLVVTTVSQTQLNLSWIDNSSSENGFRIERVLTGQAGWVVIATTDANATTYSDTGVSCGTSYSYRVTAVSATGISTPAGPISAATAICPPAAPTSLTAHPVAMSTTISLVWTDNSNNETGFKIEQSPHGEDVWTFIATVSNTNGYKVSGLPCQTSYDFRVRATNAAGDSALSNVASATTLICIPAAPSGLVATAASPTQIDLSWQDNSDNETWFEVERWISSANTWSGIKSIPPNVTSYSDIYLTCATSYDYRVIATNSSGDSAPSAAVTGTTAPCPPKTPSNLRASATSQTVMNITWVYNLTNTTGFRLERSPAGQDNWAFLANTTTGSYNDTGLTCNTTYDYRVSSFNADGSSPLVGPASATTLPCTPAPPTGLSATRISQYQINLTWTDLSDNETAFRIERSTTGTGGWSFQNAPANSTSFSDLSSLGCGTLYYYRVLSLNSGGISSPSDIASAATAICSPTAPQSLVATPISQTQINLSWTDRSNNETGFKVEISRPGQDMWALVATTGANATTYSVTNLLCGTSYDLRVAATNEGGTSAYIARGMVSPSPCIPAAPSGLGASAVSQTQIDLAWTDHSNNETGFKVERSLHGLNTWALIKTTTANATAYSDTGRTCGTAYDYRVTATNTGGSSAYSNAASATSSACASGVPTGLTATAVSQTGIDLAWTDNSSIEDGFNVERSAAGANTWVEIATLPANTTTFSDTGLTCGTGYDYRVSAFGVSGNTVHSAVAGAVTASCLASAPTNLAATAISQTRIDVTWADSVDNEDGFKVERSPHGQNTWTEVNTTTAGATSYSDTGLACGTTYDYRVFAFDAASVTAPSNIGDATTLACAPAAPSGLSATAASQTQIDLAWTDHSNNETGFKVERSPAGMDTWTLLATTATDVTTYSDANLTCGVGYDYRVSATNAGSDSAVSPVASASTLPCPPSPPGDLSVVAATQTRIDLAWTDTSANEDGFKVERSPSGEDDWTVLATTEATTTFSNTGLSCSADYDYRVSATNAGGDSPASGVANASTLPCTPLPPSGLTANAASQTRIDFTWTDNSNNEDTFRIERSPAGEAHWTLLATTSEDTTSYSNSGLTCGAGYDYRVFATNAGGSSPASAIASMSTIDCASGAPGNAVAVPVSQTRIDLTWVDHSDNETGFSIERSPHGLGAWAEINTAGPGQTSFSDTGLDCGTGYDYRVTAFDGIGVTRSSNVASATTVICSPAAPDNLSAAAASRTQINLTWVDHASNETGFKIQRAPAGSASWTLIHTTGADKTGYSDETAACGAGYDYRVIATNQGGDSGQSNIASAVTPACLAGTPSQPKITLPAKTLVTAHNTPAFAWTASVNADRYEIQIARDSKFKQIVQPGTSAVPDYTASRLDDGLYFVHVRGVNSNGVAGKWSATRKVTIDTTPPPAPTLKKTLTVKGGFNLIVLKSRGATGYVFQVSTDPDFGSVPLGGTAKKTTYKLLTRQLVSHTTYYWRVAAMDKLGNTSDWSSIGSFTTD